MHKYEFNVTIHVPVEVEAEDVLAAKALVEKEADELLFQTDPVMRSDIPDLDCDLVGVDGRDPNVDEVRVLLESMGGAG
jgi:hypothetical protein